MNVKRVLTLALAAAATLVLSLPSPPAAAQEKKPDPFAPVRFMIGEWNGTSEGQAGKGTVRRAYELVLKDKYIYEKNVSTYPAQGANRAGEVHEHWSFISYDRARKTLVLRQFHPEGFVNQYSLNKELSGPKKLVFDSEALENSPAGWKARETYDIISNDEFTETFSLGEPGKELELYVKNTFKRAG